MDVLLRDDADALHGPHLRRPEHHIWPLRDVPLGHAPLGHASRASAFVEHFVFIFCHEKFRTCLTGWTTQPFALGLITICTVSRCDFPGATVKEIATFSSNLLKFRFGKDLIDHIGSRLGYYLIKSLFFILGGIKR